MSSRGDYPLVLPQHVSKVGDAHDEVLELGVEEHRDEEVSPPPRSTPLDLMGRDAIREGHLDRTRGKGEQGDEGQQWFVGG
jgi:hypothetical protein